MRGSAGSDYIINQGQLNPFDSMAVPDAKGINHAAQSISLSLQMLGLGVAVTVEAIASNSTLSQYGAELLGDDIALIVASSREGSPV